MTETDIQSSTNANYLTKQLRQIIEKRLAKYYLATIVFFKSQCCSTPNSDATSLRWQLTRKVLDGNSSRDEIVQKNQIDLRSIWIL